MSTSLDFIKEVHLGLPPKLRSYFSVADQERAFSLIMNSPKAATFIAPTSLERDALVQGFESLLMKLKKAGRGCYIPRLDNDEQFDLGLDLGLDI